MNCLLQSFKPWFVNIFLLNRSSHIVLTSVRPTWGLVLVRHTLLRIARHIDLLQKRLCGQLHLRAWFQCFCVRRGVLSTVASSLESMLNLQSALRLLKFDVLVLRCQMQGPTRRSSRRDRQCELQRLADRFFIHSIFGKPA